MCYAAPLPAPPTLPTLSTAHNNYKTTSDAGPITAATTENGIKKGKLRFQFSFVILWKCLDLIGFKFINLCMLDKKIHNI